MAAVGKRRRRALAHAAILTLLATSSAFAATTPSEYQVKAVFLFNFAHFVEWPPSAFSTVNSPFVICVVGHDPFGPALDDTVRGETIKGRSFTVARHRQLSEAIGCQILFTDRTAEKLVQSELKELAHKGTLTVGESGAATPQDVVICFVTENQKIRLRINVEAARVAGLIISSKLLRPAQLVGSMDTN